MKKKLCVILVLGGLMSIFFSNPVYTAEKSKAKSIILTTMDVKEAYEVIGIVSHRTSSQDINGIINEIKKAAIGLKADAVVGLRCVSYGDYFYAYGTAVKFKE